ncbi:leucine-rich repeat protein kinase family protein [Striga asiatica]|uniref:Leucine-rich repeat protein kinase family protein n=1 Tax=Striga asiatica TaxID=4170 RepID=A0A5A7PAA3_STRAF|nr:leucine-rich repeat protein kinase family protein [Striga asiatica]
MASSHHRSRLLLLLLSLLTLLPPTFSLLAGELSALLRLRAAVRGRTLLWNTTAASPCSWEGVACDDATGHVVSLRLPADGLTGIIPANTIGNLTQLQTLSLRQNSLSGEIPPDIASCALLQDLHLQGNTFSGQIPASFFTLTNLARVNLAENNFSGNLSPEFDRLTNLRTLYLENNRLTGSLPNFGALIRLRNFNVSFNGLTGPIPSGLAQFPAQSFLGNPLCGPPLLSCPDTNGSTLSNGAIAGIAVGSSFLLLLILIIFIFSWRKYRSRKILPGANSSPLEHQIRSPTPIIFWDENSHSSGKKDSSESRKTEELKSVGVDGLVFLGKNVESFSLQELLSALAEVLGQGSVGSTYKAYLDSGVEVIVKRLKNVCVGEEEFRNKIEEVGLIVHENLEGAKGYFYGREEKLLLYEPMPNGSLYALLHGSNKRPLSLENRAKIALGIACGIKHLHSALATTHGNIKSSNVFLTDFYTPRVSEYGLTQLVHQAAGPNGYRAQEVVDPRNISREADVYSFGVLLLELLTRKEPSRVLTEEGVELSSWVGSVAEENWSAEVFDPDLLRYGDGFKEGLMLRLLRLAVSCAGQNPEMRPVMEEVVREIEEICVSSF